MIQSREDLKYYIECDLRSLGLYPLSSKEKWGGTETVNMEVSNHAT